jgi:hypothetical protein
MELLIHFRKTEHAMDLFNAMNKLPPSIEERTKRITRIKVTGKTLDLEYKSEAEIALAENREENKNIKAYLYHCLDRSLMTKILEGLMDDISKLFPSFCDSNVYQMFSKWKTKSNPQEYSCSLLKALSIQGDDVLGYPTFCVYSYRNFAYLRDGTGIRGPTIPVHSMVEANILQVDGTSRRQVVRVMTLMRFERKTAAMFDDKQRRMKSTVIDQAFVVIVAPMEKVINPGLVSKLPFDIYKYVYNRDAIQLRCCTGEDIRRPVFNISVNTDADLLKNNVDKWDNKQMFYVITIDRWRRTIPCDYESFYNNADKQSADPGWMCFEKPLSIANFKDEFLKL